MAQRPLEHRRDCSDHGRGGPGEGPDQVIDEIQRSEVRGAVELPQVPGMKIGERGARARRAIPGAFRTLRRNEASRSGLRYCLRCLVVSSALFCRGLALRSRRALAAVTSSGPWLYSTCGHEGPIRHTNHRIKPAVNHTVQRCVHRAAHRSHTMPAASAGSGTPLGRGPSSPVELHRIFRPPRQSPRRCRRTRMPMPWSPS